MSISASPNSDTGFVGGGTKRQPVAPWTPEYLAFVLPLKPEEILQRATGDGRGGVTVESRLEWRWIDLAQRFVWLYGAEEALRRLNGEPALQAAA